MKTKIKLSLLILTVILTVILVCSCGNESPYESYNEDGYSLSIKYDANGGEFTTGTSVIVDTYATESITPDDEGNKSISLIDPSDKAKRGEMNAFIPTRSGYSLVGWYTERNEVTDSEGNVQYTYSGRWDFNTDRYTFSASAEQSAETPALTLYAAWVKDFVYEFYYEGELISSITVNPIYTSSIKQPNWDLDKGTINMEKFPKINGKTFVAVYSDEAMTELITDESIAHSGNLDLETATAGDTTMKLYIEMKEGNWYKISTADQLIKNASVVGCYEILADLDFSGKAWPSAFSTKNFSGTIIGGGHTLSGITAEQTDMTGEYFGLFGQITAKATIQDVNFEDTTVKILKGTRKQIARYGLLAGTVETGASISGVTVSNGLLQIDSSANLASDIEVGLIIGWGYELVNIDYSSVRCESIDKDTYLDVIEISIDGNSITLTKVPKQEMN